MTTLTGHLTATEKRHIKALLDAGLMAGKVNRKTYHLEQAGDIYTVKVTENLTDWCETRPKPVIYKHTFKL